MINVERVTAAGLGFFFFFFFFLCRLSWLNVALAPGGDGGKPVSHAPRPISPTAPSPPYLPSNLPFPRHKGGEFPPAAFRTDDV